MSETQNAILFASAIVAITAVVGLSVAQSDQFSRRALTPARLQAKRLQEYAYRWEQSIEKALMRAQIYLAGGSVEAQLVYSSEQQQGQMGKAAPSKVWDEDGITDLITEWMQEDKKLQKDSGSSSSGKNNTPFPQILGFSREEESREILVELYHPKSGAYELPLIKFGMVLADILEETLTSTALCFVADASAGLGSQLVADLLDASKAGVAIIREPCWMAAFAKLAAERVISSERQQRILFGLCRMAALTVREQVGEMRTVMFTIPGQAVVPIMLPLLLAAFPEDRHLFVYDHCAATISRGMALRSQYRRATIPTSWQDAVSFAGDASSSDPTRHTTPLRSSLTKSVLNLTPALAGLRLYHADIVESWMGSVDTFFQLKENENNNGYLPYTLKVGMLLGDPNGSLEPESERFYSLSSLLQFVTGCRSRPLPEGVFDAAREWLRDFAHKHSKEVQNQTRLTDVENKAVENCVFRHKLILIGDKTLKDTVLPKKHWTLKDTTKRGCSCCAPEDDEEEKEGQLARMMNTTGVSRDDSRVSEGDTGSGPGKSNYVDGKASFAFDPSKFSAAPAPAPARPAYVDGKNTFAFDPTKFS